MYACGQVFNNGDVLGYCHLVDNDWWGFLHLFLCSLLSNTVDGVIVELLVCLSCYPLRSPAKAYVMYM